MKSRFGLLQIWSAAALLVAAGSVQAGDRPVLRGSGTLVKDRYIVVLDDARVGKRADVQALAEELTGRVGGGEVVSTYRTALRGFTVRMPAAAAERMAREGQVKYVEQDQLVSLVDTQFNPPYNLDRTDQRALPLDSSYTYPADAGAGVHIYVLDTGINPDHVDFAGRIGQGQNFYPDGARLLCTLFGIRCPTPDPNAVTDCNGHGTHVSGTAMGTTYGLAKQAIVHPVRSFGCGNSTATSYIISGVDWIAANHESPAVANMSLGGGVSEVTDDAVEGMIAAGVTTVVAAGNSDADACTQSPARVPAAITAGSTTSTDARSSFSNFGSCVDLFAPGSNITSAAYDDNDGTLVLSGTSMSSPLVAGAVARYLENNPSATPAQATAAILAAATAGAVSDPQGSPNLLLYADPAQ